MNPVAIAELSTIMLNLYKQPEGAIFSLVHFAKVGQTTKQMIVKRNLVISQWERVSSNPSCEYL